MAKLIYSAIASLDGYIADAQGSFDWCRPDAEVHGFANDLERQIGTHLYGRRMYEVMVFWETADLSGEPAVMGEFAELWQDADKVVYSSSLETVSTARTRMEREFDPAAVRQLKASAARDLSIGGATLAAQAQRAGLVDECHLFLAPVVVGAGQPAFPDPLRVSFDLLGERRFAGGFVHLHYRVRAADPA